MGLATDHTAKKNQTRYCALVLCSVYEGFDKAVQTESNRENMRAHVPQIHFDSEKPKSVLLQGNPSPGLVYVS